MAERRGLRSKLKSLAANLLLMTLSIFIACGAVEVVLRILYGSPIIWRDPKVSHMFTDYGYKPKPNQQQSYTGDMKVTTNSYGFRDYEWKVPKEVGTKRIMVIGDSITFGNSAAFETIYPKVLERMLQQTYDDVEVIVAAAGGWQPYNEAGFLKHEGLTYEPDMVIVAFFYNDFAPKKKLSHKLTDTGREESRPSYVRWVPYNIDYFLRKSAFVMYIRGRLRPLFRQPLHVISMDKSFQTRLFENTIDMDNDPAIQDAYSYLKEIKSLCDTHGIDMLLIHIPSIHYFWYPQGSIIFNQHLKSFAESHGIRFLDLEEHFRAYKQTDSLYRYPWDSHLSARGHEAVAEALSPLLGEWLSTSQ